MEGTKRDTQATRERFRRTGAAAFDEREHPVQQPESFLYFHGLVGWVALKIAPPQLLQIFNTICVHKLGIYAKTAIIPLNNGRF